MTAGPGGVAVFPGAGSFGGEFKELLATVAQPAWLVRYPGRFGRDFGTPAGSFDEVVTACAAQVRRRAVTAPLLVGHSYGAYLAYATAARLVEEGTAVAGLVVIGADAPQLVTVAEAAVRGLPETAAYLEGIDPGLLPADGSDGWREIVVETARADLLLLREFTASPYRELHCPVAVAHGASDPLVTPAGVAGWADATSGGCTRRVFPGGHSDLLRSPGLGAWLEEVTQRTAV
ncbi:thioesterase II family protein [Streptomyces sclerotialus]|uniref:thioesterase II family protein n=1 Tax=Streptomyces sclerotialus TaxID=1957 RepID=UPI0004C96BB7